MESFNRDWFYDNARLGRSLNVGWKKQMRTTILIALLCASSVMAEPDEGLRAFLGIKSAGITLTKIDREVTYVYALARFEKATFIGFDQVSNGSSARQKEATFEIVWGKKNDQYGYSFIAGTASHEFKTDPIYEHFNPGSRAKGEFDNAMQTAPEFKGMKVLTGAFSSFPKDPMFYFNAAAKVEDNLEKVDYAVLVLLKECRSIKESIDFMHALKK